MSPALIAFSREEGNPRRALTYARRLADVDSADAEVRQLVDRLDAEARR